MQETRRQLFKTSILSVFGLIAAPAIAEAAGTVAEYSVARAKSKNKNVDCDILFQSGPTGDVLAFYITPSDARHPAQLPTELFDIKTKLLETDVFDLERVKNDTLTIDKIAVDVKKGVVTSDMSTLAGSAWSEIGEYRRLRTHN